MLVPSILKHLNTILLMTLPKMNGKKEFLLTENKESNKQKNPKLNHQRAVNKLTETGEQNEQRH